MQPSADDLRAVLGRTASLLEVPDVRRTDFRKAVKAEPGEKIVLSWVVWPDRETGAKVHEGMFADPPMADVVEMPFDGKRMIMGGFEPILTYRRVEG